MRFDDDYNDNYNDGGGGLPILYMALGVSLFVLAVMGVVILANKKNQGSGGNYAAYMAANTPEAVAVTVAPDVSKRTADDLDIWDMYPERVVESVAEEESQSEEATVSPEVTPMSDDEKYNDGKHFKIEYKDGSSEWLTIDPSREKNNYDFTNVISSDGKMRYYSDGRAVSFLGIDVSRYQKDIDFAKVKEAGIEFVMIRVGARGYQSGQISMDEYFTQNIDRATEAGLDVGVYFYSQAISVEEAAEEANLLIQACNEKKITYPVAYDMEFVDNDTSRIETLSRDERTLITATFLNKIAEAGYKPMLYGDKEWLVKRIDSAKFPGVNVWLADDSQMPDYPYQFSMWQYTTSGVVEGIQGNVDMDICFVDYKAQ